MSTKTRPKEAQKSTKNYRVVAGGQNAVIKTASKTRAVSVDDPAGRAVKLAGGRSTHAQQAQGDVSASEIAADRQHMLQLLERARASAIAEGLPLLDLDGIEEEVASRRGGIY